ncbi:hypothetical protein GQ53DRAFT_754747 [Thozetella sp. PMI_491]|nr:hypothetical protein GQ53DRAFT_754747 [Thozetella sp. PMI_491]
MELLPTQESEQQWTQAAQEPRLRTLPTRAVIHTFPDPYWTTNLNTAYAPEDEDLESFHLAGRSSFFAALARLPELPNVQDIALCFTPECNGDGNASYASYPLGPEPRWLRADVLRAFFSAAAAHRRTPGNAPIRALTVRNLQNVAESVITASEDFVETMRDVTSLHLQICTEHEPKNELAVDKPEMRTFWPSLRKEWLEPLAGQLEHLTLYWDNHWGMMPSIDLAGLHFPRLKSLSLGTFVFGKDEQLEWLLQHRTLEHLAFDSCTICFHWELYGSPWEEPFDRSGLTPKEVDPARLKESWVDSILTYDGTWSRYFDRIATGLPRLKKFQMGYTWAPWGGGFEGCDSRFEDREKIGAELHHCRYVAFTSETAPGPFLDPNTPDGIFYGLNFETESPTKRIGDADQKSLNALLRTVDARR